MVDPVKRTIEGRFNSLEAGFASSYDFDPERHRIYFPLRSGYEFSLTEFDTEAFRPVRYFRSSWVDVQIRDNPESTTLIDDRYLAFGGIGGEAPMTVLFPLSLLQPLPAWKRPAPVPLSSEVRRIPLPNSAVVSDPYRDRIYAALPSWAFDVGNSVVAIDPIAGNVGDPVWVGPDPWQMAVSDQGKYLYAALYNGWGVRRLELPELTPDLRIPIATGNRPPWGVRPSRIYEIHPVPGRPESFVAVRAGLPRDTNDIVPQGVAIYDHDVPRPKTTPEWPFEGYDYSGIHSVQ